MNSDDRDPRARFSDRVRDYIRYRPGYPIEVIRTLEDEIRIDPNRTRVVDLGSGTGISAELFLREGYAVVGVEPNDAMRSAGEEQLAPFARFRSVAGSAEATTLDAGSADLVVAAQAFHWFDRGPARREMLRISAPARQSGQGDTTVPALALLWNDRRVDVGPFLRLYDEALKRWAIDYEKVNHQNLTDDDVATFFGPRGCNLRIFPQHQDFDRKGFLGRALSSSYVPLPGQRGHDELIAELHALYDQHEIAGTVRFEYDTKLYFGTLD